MQQLTEIVVPVESLAVQHRACGPPMVQSGGAVERLQTQIFLRLHLVVHLEPVEQENLVAWSKCGVGMRLVFGRVHCGERVQWLVREGVVGTCTVPSFFGWYVGLQVYIVPEMFRQDLFSRC